MDCISLFHLPSFLLPFLGIAALVGVAAYTIIYRRPPEALKNVAMRVQHIDVLELAALLDPLVPLILRESLADEAYRRELDSHIQLVQEYVSRVNHNVRVLHKWVAGEYAALARKNVRNYTPQERLVVEAQQIAWNLKKYVLAANTILWVWAAFRMDRWPVRFLPSIPNLRTLYGIDLLANYRRLTEITQMLSQSGQARGGEVFGEAW